MGSDCFGLNLHFSLSSQGIFNLQKTHVVTAILLLDRASRYLKEIMLYRRGAVRPVVSLEVEADNESAAPLADGPGNALVAAPAACEATGKAKAKANKGRKIQNAWTHIFTHGFICHDRAFIGFVFFKMVGISPSRYN